MVRHQESLEASRALRRAAHDLTAVCVRFIGQQNAPVLPDPIPADMADLLRRIDEKTGGTS